MDNFSIIYQILNYLEVAMDEDEIDAACISSETLGITENRWKHIMEMLINSGYVEGAQVVRDLSGNVRIALIQPRITLIGLEYLSENDQMKKVAAAIKNAAGAAISAVGSAVVSGMVK